MTRVIKELIKEGKIHENVDEIQNNLMDIYMDKVHAFLEEFDLTPE